MTRWKDESEGVRRRKEGKRGEKNGQERIDVNSEERSDEGGRVRDVE